ncbi:MAG: MFS transporter [Candidatus Paceibacterota bacterium]
MSFFASTSRVLSEKQSLFWKFFPFWMFMLFYKFAGAVHYSLISPYGERLLPLWIVGLLMGGSSVIQLLLDVPAGRIMDRFGYLKFLKITTFLFLLAGLFLLFGLNEFTYYGSLLLATFGWLFFGPGNIAYALAKAPAGQAGRFISTKDTFSSIGVVLSSASLPLILVLPPQIVGWILTVFFILSLAFLYWSPADEQSKRAPLPAESFYKKREPLGKVIKALGRLNPASGMLLLSGISSGIFYGTIWFVIPLVILTHASSGLLGLGLGIFDFSIVVLGYVLGTLADRANKRSLVFFGLLTFALAGILVSFNLSWLFLLFGFIATAGDELASLALWSWLHTLDKKHANDGAISGVINLFSDLGWAIGPIMAGFLYVLVGPSWTILVGALPAALVWIIYEFLMHKHKHAPLAPGQVKVIPPKPYRARHRT